MFWGWRFLFIGFQGMGMCSSTMMVGLELWMKLAWYEMRVYSM